VISIWLAPAEEDAAYLQEIINELAHEFQVPVFFPHCTLISPLDKNADEIENCLSIAGEKTVPIYVTLAGISHSSTIWKTVFMELEESPGLIDLQQRVIDQVPSVPPYDFKPHISLIYKKMPIELKEEIICNLAVRNSYKMDKIIAIKTGPNVEQWEKVLEVTLHA
jgi:2'-5' RNA ligase